MAVKQLGLTSRELEVVHRLAAGCAKPEIARELGISNATLQVHLASIAAKAIRLSVTTARLAPGDPVSATYNGSGAGELPAGELLAQELAAGVLRGGGLHPNRAGWLSETQG